MNFLRCHFSFNYKIITCYIVKLILKWLLLLPPCYSNVDKFPSCSVVSCSFFPGTTPSTPPPPPHPATHGLLCIKILRPSLRDIVNFSIGLSYRSASLCSPAAGTTTLCQSRLYSQVKELRTWPLYSTCSDSFIMHSSCNLLFENSLLNFGNHVNHAI